MKKIVILSAFLTPFRSGAEACVEEVSALLKDTYDITIVTARLRRDLPYLDKLPSGVQIWRVGIGAGIDKWLFPFLAPKVVKALRPDIVHAVLESYAGLAMIRCKNVKKILTCQSTNTLLLLKTMHRSADVVTAISSVLVKRAENFGKTAVLIPNGIRLKDLQDARMKHIKIPGRILFVGRLEQMKGVDTLLRAFKETRDKMQDTNLNLRIVGDGSDRRMLENLTHELGLTDHVTFTGYVPADQVSSEFAQAEIFCGLSRSEALGNVFLEAQAAGCAVIGTNVGGIPDIIENGRTGLLVAPDDVVAAASAIERLITNEVLYKQVSEMGEEHAKHYDWANIAHKYTEIYQKL